MPQSVPSVSTDSTAATDDPFLWLEALEGDEGERALQWVRERNEGTLAVLKAEPEFEPVREELLQILNARDRIPHVARRGDWFYNLWQDEAHPRGLWRRCTLEEYQLAEPPWRLVLDLDALGRDEGRSWVFHGATSLAPEYRRCLVSLSDGGADAHELREFDLETLRFIAPADGGFFVPEAKSDVEWLDADTLLVGSDFGPDSLTESGYPRQVRRWARGTPLDVAPVIFEGEKADVSVSASVDRTPGYERVVFSRALDFYNESRFLWKDGAFVPIDLPSDMSVHLEGPWMLLRPRTDWAIPHGPTYPSGSLLLMEEASFWKNERHDKHIRVMFSPTAGRSLEDYTLTQHHLLINVSEHVASRLEEWDLSHRPPTLRQVKAPFPGTLSVQSLHDPELPGDTLGDAYLLHYCDFLTPDIVCLARAGVDARETLKQRGAQFDAHGMTVEQRFATSADGETVPYFVIGRRGRDAQAQKETPTLLYGYGGFEVSLQPWYSGGNGRAWLARGGQLVVANIRGGGEYGPRWHQAATLEHKQRSFDDFIAVAEDLIAHGLTRPERLGIMGGSNGGLLVGACMVQRPELFGAVVCQVPLLDMKRYHLLLAGASWMAEYGDPDDADDWAHIAAYSPYQQLKAGVKYPRALFATSTRDDRVHPGHARKMAARMLALGQACFYFENIEGGHGGAADNQQRALLQALEFAYLWRQLGREAIRGDAS
ncbi:prolyl oligopeptidase family protein [Mitsuaria sp. 7]|uniref:prolyl oligopeptidase family serine peptidase n=1 Tax=Mitsuaria sp. 7 TaxID=1658665 RepID=UPI000AA1EC85|nr:prolyl oligopeptidase family serine peptidase [Mitsuaria sp. 7]